MPRKNRTVWVSRDLDADHRPVDLWFGCPCMREDGVYVEVPRSRFIDEFCPEDFARVTGLRLKPGECKRVRFSVEVIDG